MDKTINFQIDLTQREIDLLKSILNCDDNSLEQVLSKISKAALSDYYKMILGEKAFTRGKDMQEYRLLNLVKHYFDGQIPSEQQISGLFQLKTTESRSLISAVTSKYQYELKEAIKTSLGKRLDEKAMKNGDTDFKIYFDSAFYKDELNKILMNIDPKLPMIEKDNQTTGNYTIKPSSYSALCGYFGIAETTKPY